MEKLLPAAFLASVVVTLAASVASAGDIYGNIDTADGSARQNITIEVTIQDNHYTASASAPGSYRVHGDATGPGSLRAVVDGVPSNTVDVYSVQSPTRWNLVLAPQGSGFGLKVKP